MKIIEKIILSLFVTVFFASCEGFLDVNTDKTSPATAPYEMVFPAAVTSSASVIGGQYAILGSLWAQHFTQSNTANQYKVIDGYRLTSSEFNTSFNELYSGALNDLSRVAEESSAAGDWNTYLMAKTIRVYTFQILADLYDQIPYTDALKGVSAGNISPKYDSCRIVYDGLIKELDEALAKDFSAKTNKNIGSKDFIFGGDIELWKQFANTLKLKIYLRQVNIRPVVAKAGIEKLYSDNVTFLSTDAKLAVFSAEVNKQNPLYGSEVQYLGDPNLRASQTLFNFLSANSDPRLDKIYKAPASGHKALKQGDYLALSTAYPNGSLSSGQFSATDPVYFITESESYFMQAEALTRYTSIAGNAKNLYEMGVGAAFERLGLIGSAPFLDTNGAYDFAKATTTEGKISAIITQKWIASAIAQPIEGFFDFNRTGYPSIFTVSVNSAIGAAFPKRLLFAADERSRNPNTPAQVAIDVKVWWAK